MIETFEVLPPDNTIETEDFGFFKGSKIICIYKITVNDKIVYIGKSEDTEQRWFNHIKHILNPHDSEGNRDMYIELRKAFVRGKKIKISKIQFCKKKEIKELEAYYIDKHLPPLNTHIPKYGDRKGYRKKVEQLE